MRLYLLIKLNFYFRHNIEIGRGKDKEWMKKIFRFGVMGYNAKIETVDHFLECLDESLEYARSALVKN